LLEPAAAAFAATNASATELNALREAHQTASDARDMPDFEHWDAEFHHRVFASCRNVFLKEIHNLMRAIRNQSPWFEMKKRWFSEERRLGYCDEHQAILDCLVRRDPEGAKNAMLAQLRTVERNLLGRQARASPQSCNKRPLSPQRGRRSARAGSRGAGRPPPSGVHRQAGAVPIVGPLSGDGR
jgi:DNA-binding FadR family transcriptional regulator